MSDPQDFHYMSVLRQLEIEAGVLRGGRRQSADRQDANRLMVIFGEAKRRLALVKVSQGEKISLNLKFSRENQLKAEQAIIANLRRLTEDPEAIGEWPPRIPVGRMVERFTSTAIGLHSENPREGFASSLATAFEKAVLPALAWGLMVRLYELPEELRAATQAKLVERLLDEGAAGVTEVALGGEAYRKVAIPYLRMTEAWFRLCAEDKLCALPSAVRTRLRRSLADRFRLSLGELDTLLWHELGALYAIASAGSERARAVALAGGDAAFMRERLALFAAARRDDIQDFRLLTEQRPDEAVKRTFACEQENPPARVEAGLEAGGAAFWLACAAFGKHGRPHADAASARTLLLLLRAAVMLRERPELEVTCLRYAAGFATNPRYTRSGLVMDFQPRLVELYARNSLARPALVEQFRGRIAWQRWQAGDKSEKPRALEHYRKALELHDQGDHGLDAEGPIHFFPELVVLLGQDSEQGKRAEPDLRTVDYITQRNYGIYFDIEKEERLINAGLEEYRGQQAYLAQERAREEQARSSRSADIESEDDELGQPLEFTSLLKRSDYRKYQALIRQLWGE
jgi:hypothetical protein